MNKLLDKDQLEEKIEFLHSKIIELGRKGVQCELISRVEILLQVCRSVLGKMQIVNANDYVSQVEEIIQKIEDKNKNQIERYEQNQIHNS